MQNQELTEFITLSGKLKPFKNDCISDMDYFITTLSEIKGKKVRPDLIGSIITHYASKWLPDLAVDDDGGDAQPPVTTSESIAVSLTKKRFIIESLVGILPPERDSIPCNFLLRLLRVANMVRVDPSCVSELETRVSWQLHQASLKELMIPSFSHTCTTLLDVELVLRLVKRFVSMEEAAKAGAAAVMKLAKLVDCYLAETAVDSSLGLHEFAALASALPSHARSTDDRLYRAVDTYLKAHPGLSKQGRKKLCSLIDCNKLSQEACIHAAQNERIPVRAVIQVLLSEQSKLVSQIEWSGSLSGAPSPSGFGLDLSARCFSKRETNIQQMEIKRLKEDVLRLQSQCIAMERQIEKLVEKKRSRGLYFSWKKIAISTFKSNKFEGQSEAGFGPKSPVKISRGRTPNRRKSLS
ncbi:hypothetical protein ACS0TY_012479 [Phlomoides rotata]